MRRVLGPAVVVLIAVSFAGSPQIARGRDEADRPNIVYILADDKS